MTSKNELAYKTKILRITNQIHTAQDLDEIFLQLHGQIMELFDAERLTIYAVDTEKNELFSKYKIGDEIKQIRVKIDKKSISGFVAFSKTSVNIKDAYDDEELKRYDPELSFNQTYDTQSGFRTKQVLASAIVFKEEILGVLQLINKKNGVPFDHYDLSFIKEVARSLGIGFCNQSYRQKKIFEKFSFLIRKSLMTEQELRSIIEKTRAEDRDMILILRQEHGIEKKDILDALSHYYYCPFLEYGMKITIDRKLLMGLDVDLLTQKLWLPLRKENEMVDVLIDDPTNIQKVNEIRESLQTSKLRFLVALPEDILKYLHGIKYTSNL
ncbi:MAG: GAF domain-containing protein [bacterium]